VKKNILHNLTSVFKVWTFYLPRDGIIDILLPVDPTTMISIPIINSAIPKKTDTNTAPAYGDAITKKDKAMAKAPALSRNKVLPTGLRCQET
jgi:hypothetical protein